MKRILLTSVALGVLAVGTPAMSADLPIKAAPPVAHVYDWSGVYIGGFGGYAFGNHNLNDALGPLPTGFSTFTANWESHGPLAGGEVGAYWQSGQFVWGVAGDGAWTNINGTDNNTIGQNGLVQIDSNRLIG
jgi:outer membrane immunogenic protein